MAEARLAGIATTYEYVPNEETVLAGVAATYEFETIEETVLPDPVITLTPANGAVAVPRSSRIVAVFDGFEELDLGAIAVLYTQSPVPPGGGANILVYSGSAFHPSFQSSASRVLVENAGWKITIEAQPLFGHLPAGVITIRAAIDMYDNPIVATAVWTAADDAIASNQRAELVRMDTLARRRGVTPLNRAKSTYDFSVDLSVTGADQEWTINEAYAADLGDQFNESPWGAQPLNNVRRIKVLSKLGEYPIDPYDTTATLEYDGTTSRPFPVFADRAAPLASEESFRSDVHTDNAERRFRYYTVFVLVPPTEERPDWVWAYAEGVTSSSAFSYGRYGHSAKLFEFLPRAWRIIDGEG